ASDFVAGGSRMNVFNKMKQVIGEMKEESYRMLFWNSNNDQAFFRDGVSVLPFEVKKATLDQTFKYIEPQIKNNCLTFPHLAFTNIPEKWISDKDITHIYYFTDGQIGYGSCSAYELTDLKQKLADSIVRLFDKHNNIQLNIVTVETNSYDFGNIESMAKAAGCDIYKIVTEKKLTKYITKFMSITPNNLNGFLHINKITPPAGHIPYSDSYFSELKTNEFIQYIYEKINETKSEDELLKIVQNLSVTLSFLIKDKPENIKSSIIRNFCGMFRQTTLDPLFVNFILTESIKRENDGQANIFAEYRAKLKNLFKEANELLFKSVKDALGAEKTFCTIPFENVIVTGATQFIDSPVSVANKSYQQASVALNNIIVPIIPLETKNLSPMNEQCLRQWIRATVGKLFRIDPLGDLIIFMVMGIMLRVISSDVDQTIKDCYRHLVTVMLRKKRLNTNVTELERLEQGELPIPNSGKVEEFYKYMNSVQQYLGMTDYNPLTMWYILCSATGNHKLTAKQSNHCSEAVQQNGLEQKTIMETVMARIREQKMTFRCVNLPVELALEYDCPITLENVSKTGGHKILEHQTVTGYMCSPNYVLSETGYSDLIRSNNCVCPVCYTRLTQANFQKVDPKPDFDLATLQVFDKNTKDIFRTSESDKGSRAVPSGAPKSNQTQTQRPTRNGGLRMEGKGTVIVLEGTVGSGKSTFASMIKEEIEKKGGICIVEGTDKYCKNGSTIQEAVRTVTEELLKLSGSTNPLTVAVIDTCGDRKGKLIFDIDFSGWNRQTVRPNFNQQRIKQYLAWSLRNVLMREPHNAMTNYYLEPTTAGFGKCVEIHSKKSNGVFGKKQSKLFDVQPSTKEMALKMIAENADSYRDFLAESMPLNEQVQKLLASI
ncbi:MAG: putative ATP-binding protein, partial [Dasosvirus sp.]